MNWRDKIINILKQSETVDLQPPYRVMPAGYSNKWYEYKSDRILSIPIIVECKECCGAGTNWEATNELDRDRNCPSCKGSGQRPLMKVRRCPKWKIEQIHHPSWCSICDGIGKITELLTLADIDWGQSKLKLKKGCEVE